VGAFLPNTLRLRPGLALLDGVALVVAALAAHFIRFIPSDRAAKLAEVGGHPGLVVFALVSLWVLAAAAELYEPLVIRSRREVTARVVVVTAAWAGTLALMSYAVPQWRFGRGLLLLTAAGWGLIGGLARVLLAQWAKGRPRPVALVVGEREAVADVCRRLGRHPLTPWQPLEALGATSEVAVEAKSRHAELVILAGREGDSGDLAGDLAALHFSGVPVVVASEVWAWLDGRLPLGELSPTAFLHQPGFGAVHWELFNRLTRVLDLVLGALFWLVTLPVLLTAMFGVLIFDGRPVFYRQVRLGRYGRRFELVKLRTMRRDAEGAGPAFAVPNDPRATRFGRVLRRLRLDELPQLWNVLRGEMSLVGPRPERPEFVAQLVQEIPYYTFRLAVPPGLTGWAQVNMPYARTVEEHRRRLEFDLYFIRERTVGLYFLTLLRTASAALLGAGR
jgi:exopolysaccharide biosynthesis polyprenyl glycosylphosphotransferase